jgi:hypothetical protein
MQCEKVANVINCNYNDKTGLGDSFHFCLDFQNSFKFSSQSHLKLRKSRPSFLSFLHHLYIYVQCMYSSSFIDVFNGNMSAA